MLTAVLVTAALGMLGAGSVSYLLARQATLESVDRALQQEHEEIDTIVALSASGEVGHEVTSPDDVLRIAIRQTVPDPGEGILGVVDGRAVWTPVSGDAFQQGLAGDEELVRAAAATRPGTPVSVRQLDRPGVGRTAYISVPVEVAGSPQLGHYVAAVDVRAAMAPVYRTHLAYAVICLVALGLVALVGHRVVGRLLAPLRALRETAQRITETDLAGRIPAAQLSSRDEVSDLGQTVNAMLDRLAVSFDSQRQTLDDVGHELRTPITIVRGHLETVDVDDAADVRHTRDLAIDELDRMHRLVDELLVLAKARRPDFVRPVASDVAALLFSVFDLVSVLDERRWVLETVPEGVIALDPQRVTQALLQLAANAVRFSAPGTSVALGGSLTPAAPHAGELRLWVRDEGIGVAPADREVIFERFGRGSAGARRDDEGAGLGLPIVAAIAEAHHGRIELDSAPGQGAAFTLVLPVDLVDDPLPAALTTPDEELAWPRS